MAEPNPPGAADLLRLFGAARALFTTPAQPKPDANPLADVVAAQHKTIREQNEAAHVMSQLIHEYRRVVKISPDDDPAEYDAAWSKIGKLEMRLAVFNCPCCALGNHTERCVCDGKSCCHPENHGA